ncbi:septum determining protein [Actinomadura sp. NBRC 104412]|uniref:TadE/TadG family type IV pilus assembly protein n=1 Tax=Actinomadura sp. NBRC 104412 TaxID=3032203 RepID=UPI0024A1113E|nr:TadE family protein [Actinomadura sp. NBRC 104412]GLZ03969.1 septum determining protein [Actinomadura sp. NBRC 104412]
MMRRAPDRGSMSMEMALVTPLFVVFLMLLAGAGRLVDAQSQVDGAARDAVRSASIARSPEGAVRLAQQAADANLNGRDWCAGGPVVVTDTSQWGPGGRVSVTISCDVDLGDLAFIGLPATKTLRGRALAPIDTFSYRGGDTGEDAQ